MPNKIWTSYLSLYQFLSEKKNWDNYVYISQGYEDKSILINTLKQVLAQMSNINITIVVVNNSITCIIIMQLTLLEPDHFHDYIIALIKTTLRTIIVSDAVISINPKHILDLYVSQTLSGKNKMSPVFNCQKEKKTHNDNNNKRLFIICFIFGNYFY